MKLSELKILEHVGWKLDKGLELDLAITLSALATNKPFPRIELSEKGQKLSKHIESISRKLLDSASDVKIIGKPSGAKPTYGSGGEPKSDLNVVIDKKAYALSVKSGAAFIMSAGSKNEYFGIVAATIELFEELYPAEAKEYKQQIIEALTPIAQHIGTNIKSSDYSIKQLKAKKESWFRSDKPKDDTEREEINRLRQDAEEIIDRDNKVLQGMYKAALKRMEAEAKDGLAAAFSTKNFGKCFIWEITTGVKKFSGVEEISSFSNPNAAYANTVVYLDGSGLYDVSTVNSPYVLDLVGKSGTRIQNVPRGWVGTYFKRKRGGETAGAQLLADSLREIEFSFKIGVDSPGKKIREEQLLELKVDTALIKNFIHALSKASLLSICDTFGLAPKISL